MTDRRKLDAAITEARAGAADSWNEWGARAAMVVERRRVDDGLLALQEAANSALDRYGALVALRARYAMPCYPRWLFAGTSVEGKLDGCNGSCPRCRELDAEARTLLGEDA